MLIDELNSWIDAVRSGHLSRRDFIARTGRLGLSLPMAGVLLMNAGIASSQPAFYKPRQRGGGGLLRLLEWQGPTLLNPHFATGVKDNVGSRIFYEPLAQWDAEANLVPILAAEIPSRENGGLAADGLSAMWKLKKGVVWHDGQPFTADDVVFNWQYAIDPAAATVTLGNFAGIRVEKIDNHTVRFVHQRPKPFWPGQHTPMMLIPRHVFAPFIGAKSREAPANLKPVGTGAYTCLDFRPADLIRAAAFPRYHMPNRPHFDTLELKGGGDSTSAARAVLQTGEYDFASSISVEDEVLKRMEGAGKGRVQNLPASATTAVYLNFTDPRLAIDGETSHAKTRHPIFSDPAVRRAIGLLIDRASVQAYIYGRQANATTNFVNIPARYASPNTRAEFDIDKARAVLDGAGWKPGADGVREKDGKRLSLLFQASIGAPVQKFQAMVKQAAQRAGIQIELKAVPSAVFFSSDPANPDVYGRFGADMQTYNWSNGSPDPEGLMQCFVSWEVSAKSNKYLGQNLVRWQSAEFDALYRAAEVELDPVKRAGLFIRMNDLVVADGHVIPVAARNAVRAVSLRLMVPDNGWHNPMYELHDWYRVAERPGTQR